MEPLNIVLSKVFLEERAKALKKLQGYKMALEINNKKKEAFAISRIRIELKKTDFWR